MDSLYVDGVGGLVERRSNHSAQKTRILRALISLDRGDVEPTAWDERLGVGFFDIVVIARHIFGDSTFTDGKLNRGKRSALNKSLNALYIDRFIDKTGSLYRGSGRGAMRDFFRNHWRILYLGRKIASFGENAASRRWRRENRFYGVRDIKVDRSKVKRIAASDYAEDWD